MMDAMPLTIILNETARSYAGDGDKLTLLDLLRDELDVTGPKLGCGEGACGACTVLLGSRAVSACQVSAAEADGQRVTTVEGLAEEGVLHPVQQAWLETGALQCGFCTPGWLTATASLLARTPHPGDERIAAELDGHVCRCCTYPRIRRAVHRAAELMEHPELLEPMPAVAAAPHLPAAPAKPWDLDSRQPESFGAAMPEGLMAVVAGDGDGHGWGAQDEAWVHVGTDGSITAFTGKVEEGQGTRTALSLLVADELSVSPGLVRLVMADTTISPFDLGTFGSRSMPHAAPPLRAAAAGAFRLLMGEASKRFGLPESDLKAADGMVAGPDGAPLAGYGDLVRGGRRVERIDPDTPVTPPERWRAAGHLARAVGSVDAVTGARRFPSDLRVDDMLHGCVLHRPSHGAVLVSADTSAAEALPGVTVVRDGDFVGVLAGRRHQARAALAAIVAEWREAVGPAPADLESYLRAHPLQGEARGGPFRHDAGDAAGALAAAPLRQDARYEAAFIAHVPLEPRAALAQWDAGKLVVCLGTSTPFRARHELAEALGLDESAIHIIVPDFGGGFGGKHGSVVALEAARLARAAGNPVKVQWSRQDEFETGYLRPAAFIDVSASVGADGLLTAWEFSNLNSGAAGIMTPYRVANQLIRYQPAEGPLAQGSYRALAATANNFARESHMDELATIAGADTVQFRLRHLDDDRLAAVLSTAAAEIGWDAEPSAGDAGASDAGVTGERTGTGIALGFEKGGRVATAARVSVGADGTVRVLTLVTAVDCGAVVHPDGLVNQVDGAVMMGLGPAMFEQITFEGRRILNGSLTDYRVPRLADTPADVRVILLDLPAEAPAGGGEAPIIAVAPAIANAIARACGVRLRTMPLLPSGRLPAGSAGRD
jgi:nicotinate dehydrogenase subunit B